VRIQLRNLILVADADVVSLTEGSIAGTVKRGPNEPPESLARGTLSEGFPTNVGDLLASAVTSGNRVVKGDRRLPGRAWRGLRNP
jgi:hypothetical protein